MRKPEDKFVEILQLFEGRRAEARRQITDMDEEIDRAVNQSSREGAGRERDRWEWLDAHLAKLENDVKSILDS